MIKRVKSISSPVQIFFLPKETREIVEKIGKIQQKPCFNLLLPWQRSSEGKQQHKYDCENVTNLAGEFREHKSQGGKLGFLKHFSPI